MAFFLLLFGACNNPFAPGIKEGEGDGLVLSDQKSEEGVFQNWRYAYILKDTLVYGRLLHDDFYFSYTDFEDDVPVEKRLVRQEDMLVTSRLFRNTGNIDLLWNDVVISVGDSLNRTVTRGFNLQVFLGPENSERVQGRATVKLKRPSVDSVWKLIVWIDESNIQ